MLIGTLIIVSIVVIFILALMFVPTPEKSARTSTPMYGYYAAPPEHGEQPPDEYEITYEYSECPSCGKNTYREWPDTWIEQFGQGTTAHEGVRHWECTSCGISGHE